MTTQISHDLEADVPLVDLQAQHLQVAEEVARGIQGVLASCHFVGGEHVSAFEREYADYLGALRCVALANGTDALELALRAVEVRPGDEVLVPANTFCATAEAVARIGATPVFVDVDDEHLLMDVDAALDKITSKTRAVMPVHLYGQAAAVEVLVEHLKDSDVAIVEDAAQSQGARRHGRAAGTFGAIAGTSFYPGKNLGAYGDAGAVVTNSEELARRVHLLGNHGSAQKYVHETLGFNSRMDAMQAVVLRAKLARLDQWNAERRHAAERYADLLAPITGVRTPGVAAGNEHVWHLYVVRVADRDRVVSQLNARGIGAGIHYPVPVHLQPAFADVSAPASFPVTEKAAGEILSLPLFPGITEDQQIRVAEALSDVLDG